MSTVSVLLPPIHLLAYSTLLGTELYQSFVMTKIAYVALPRTAFTTLQKRVFPVYFQSQSMLLIVVAATFPNGPVSLFKEKGGWIPLIFAGITAGANLLVYGPKTKQFMIERIHQETQDNLRGSDCGAKSEARQKLDRSFSKAHAMSIHLNLLTIGATLWYGWKLASRIHFDSL